MIRHILKKRAHAHQQHELHCDSLCCASRGQSARVLGFNGCENEAAKMRDLGVREGAIVTVFRDGETLLVGVDDARFAIGRAAAQNVLCQLNAIK
ncbi:MAG TPA: FeoA family protein [Abditibacteriaceae bacterium]|jgi:Fe2+ transport system protein FeoA